MEKKTIPVVFLKAHVDTYTRSDGTVVQAHDTKVQAARTDIGGGCWKSGHQAKIHAPGHAFHGREGEITGPGHATGGLRAKRIYACQITNALVSRLDMSSGEAASCQLAAVGVFAVTERPKELSRNVDDVLRHQNLTTQKFCKFLRCPPIFKISVVSQPSRRRYSIGHVTIRAIAPKLMNSQ